MFTTEESFKLKNQRKLYQSRVNLDSEMVGTLNKLK